jgi:hypothetical protein
MRFKKTKWVPVGIMTLPIGKPHNHLQDVLIIPKKEIQNPYAPERRYFQSGSVIGKWMIKHGFMKNKYKLDTNYPMKIRRSR